METAATAFALFLASVSSPVDSTARATLMEPEALQSHLVDYQNTSIDFQHSQWVINPDSICASHKIIGVRQYSQCTEAAKKLFSETCQALGKEVTPDWKQGQMKTMYCQAANSFKPTVAHIGMVRNDDGDPTFMSRQACSELTLRAANTGALAHIEERDSACKRYQRFRAQR